jgi:hypothetical protein
MDYRCLPRSLRKSYCSAEPAVTGTSDTAVRDMMNFSKIGLVTIALLASVSSHASAVNYVQNGSFEDNLQSAGGWSNYANLSGWTGGVAGIELRNGVAGSAQNGENFVELDTTRNSSMSQVLHLTHGGLYELSFWYAARPDNQGKNKNSDTLQWSLGAVSGQVLKNWKASGSTTWQQFTQTFTYSGAQNLTLKFAAKGASDSYGGSIDNVSFTNVTPVPEPETYAMFLAGLGLIGRIAMRRRSANKLA